MMNTSLQCPSCFSSDLSDRGPLPVLAAYAFVGGERIVADFAHLPGCRRCGLQFRNPTLSPSGALHLYKAAPETSWQSAERQKWPIMRSWIRGYSPNRQFLDVGCFRGDFLYWMGEAWDRAEQGRPEL